MSLIKSRDILFQTVVLVGFIFLLTWILFYYLLVWFVLTAAFHCEILKIICSYLIHFDVIKWGWNWICWEVNLDGCKIRQKVPVLLPVLDKHEPGCFLIRRNSLVQLRLSQVEARRRPSLQQTTLTRFSLLRSDPWDVWGWYSIITASTTVVFPQGSGVKVWTAAGLSGLHLYWSIQGYFSDT